MKKCTRIGIFLLISGILLLQVLATPAPANAACAGATLYGIAFDGANIWVANSGSNTVTKIRASDGSLVGTYAVYKPWGIAFDGSNLWVTNHESKSVTKLRARDGCQIGTYKVDTNPVGIAFD